jgi:hypothetical protein
MARRHPVQRGFQRACDHCGVNRRREADSATGLRNVDPGQEEIISQLGTKRFGGKDPPCPAVNSGPRSQAGNGALEIRDVGDDRAGR